MSSSSCSTRFANRRMLVLLAVLLPAGSLLAVGPAAPAYELATMEFHDAPLAEVLVAVGRAAGESVVPDETVRGRVSYYLAETSFEGAIAALAERFDLFVSREDGITTVSAFSVRRETDGSFTVRAPRAPLALLLERLSREAGTPILFERLPARELSYFADGVPLERLLRQIAGQLPNHELHRRDGAFVLGYAHEPVAAVSPEWITRDGDRFSVASEPAPLARIVDLLFRTAGREYQLLMRSSVQVPALSFTGHRFEALLALILDHADATFALTDGTYTIREAGAGSGAARGLVTRSHPLDYLSVADLLDLLPPERIAGITVRADRTANLLTITGPPRLLDPVSGLIAALDVPPRGRSYQRFTLAHLSPERLPVLLPSHLQTLTLMPLPEAHAVLALATPGQAAALREFLARADVPERTVGVRLNHLTVEELLPHLSQRQAGRIRTTPDPQGLIVTGPPETARALIAEIRELDRPTPQIRYQLLVLQLQEGRAEELELDLSNSLTTPDATDAILGSIGTLLSLSVDVISTFGYQFAARLHANIGTTAASVFADTTLNALSGHSVEFRNTNTFRYRDVVINEETGQQQPAGIVREITSGLILEITGVVRGSDVIMDVEATVSRRGSDGSSTGNPPPTSERVARTSVRTANGTPVILSGLRVLESESSIRRTPILGDIPLLGLLFQGRRETADQTELAIYIVPHIERPDREVSDGEMLMDLYRASFGGNE